MSHSDRPDTISPTLLERVRQRDNRAWERLVILFGPMVKSWARRGGVRVGDVDDVLKRLREELRGLIEIDA